MNETEIEILKKELPKMISTLLGYKSSIPELDDVTIVSIQFKKIAEHIQQLESLNADANKFKADAADVDIQHIIKPDTFHSIIAGPFKWCIDEHGKAFQWPAFKPCP